MGRLTEETKQKIIADYVMTQNKQRTADLNGVSPTTVRRVLAETDKIELFEKVRQKKTEVTESVTEYVESQGEEVKRLIGKYINALNDDEKLSHANLVQVATALGIVMDKFAPHMQTRDNRNAAIKITLDWE